MSQHTDDSATWRRVKTTMQRRWGITPPAASSDETGWGELADHIRDRAIRVGGQVLDTVRSAAKETTATVAEATDILNDDATKVGNRVKDAGGKAKTGFDVAKSALEELADDVRDGLVEGVSKARGDGNTPKSVAEGVGMAAGALLNAITGKPKKP